MTTENQNSATPVEVTSAPAAQPAAAAAATPAPSAATQAPATQVPAAPTAKEEPKAEAGAFGEAVTYQPTGDSNLDLALGFIGKHGLNDQHPAVVAATKGDFGPIKALMAEKGIQGWEAYLALAEKGYSDHVAKEDAKTAEVQQIVVQAAGDEQTWADTLAWASANAEPQEKEQVNAALKAGGVVAEAVAQFLVNGYRSATGTSYSPKENAVKQDAGRGVANPNGGPLSPAEYGKAVADLRRTKGVYFDQTPEYRQLQARRQAYRG